MRAALGGYVLVKESGVQVHRLRERQAPQVLLDLDWRVLEWKGGVWIRSWEERGFTMMVICDLCAP